MEIIRVGCGISQFVVIATDLVTLKACWFIIH
jgi:hypothetical protein